MDEDITAVDVFPSDVTREHDGGEWLAGFNQGVTAGRRDIIGALKRMFGPHVGGELELRIFELLLEA